MRYGNLGFWTTVLFAVFATQVSDAATIRHALAVREGRPLELPADFSPQEVELHWVPPCDGPAFENAFNFAGGNWTDGRLDLAKTTGTPFNGNSNFYMASQPGGGFTAKNTYFLALRYHLEGGATLTPAVATFIAPDCPSYPLTGSGWLYLRITPTNQYGSWWKFDANGGSGFIDRAYAINLSAMAASGVFTDPSLGKCVVLFGGRDLVPGQNGEAVAHPKKGGEFVQTLAIAPVEGKTLHVSHVADGSSVAKVSLKAGDKLSIDSGAAVFQAETQPGPNAAAGDWSPYLWVVCGDSLSDPTLNPVGGKYYDILHASTGIRTMVTGKGSSGNWALHGDGVCFHQRLEAIPPDADIVTLFGSVNDWKWYQRGQCPIGEATDSLAEKESVAAFVNESLKVVREKAPVAKIVMITGLYYYGVNQGKIEQVYAVMKEIAARNPDVRFVDWYAGQNAQGYDFPNAGAYGFEQINRDKFGAAFASKYTRDFSATASAYGHPSAAYNAEWLASAFSNELARVISVLRK